MHPGALVVTGSIGTAERHAHPTVQLLTAASEMVLADGNGKQRRCRAALIPPNADHAVIRGAASGILVHVDPESVAGIRLRRLTTSAESVDAWCRAGAMVCDASDWLPTILREARQPGGGRPPVIARVLIELPELVASGPVRLAHLARRVRLSESRLAHLLSAEIGLPFRPYVRWLRMQRAIGSVADGNTLTVAAHEAGFTDSAHLNRVCRKAFGAAPSAFTQIRWSAKR